MIKPKGKMNRHVGFSPGLMKFFQIDSWEIAAWCMDEKAETRPVQVHFVFRIAGFKFPFLLRFLGPDTLGFLIEELNRYRSEVWPEAESVTLEGWVKDE